MSKPTKEEYREMVRELLKWIVLSGERYETSNPYFNPTVRKGLELLARYHGHKGYLDVPLRLGKEGRND